MDELSCILKEKLNEKSVDTQLKHRLNGANRNKIIDKDHKYQRDFNQDLYTDGKVRKYTTISEDCDPDHENDLKTPKTPEHFKNRYYTGKKSSFIDDSLI